MEKNIFCLTVLLIFFFGAHMVFAQEIEDKKIAIGLYYEVGLSRLATNEAMNTSYGKNRGDILLKDNIYQEHGLLISLKLLNKFRLVSQFAVTDNGYKFVFNDIGLGIPINPYGNYIMKANYFSIGLFPTYSFVKSAKVEIATYVGINSDFLYSYDIDFASFEPDSRKPLKDFNLFTEYKKNIFFAHAGLVMDYKPTQRISLQTNFRLRHSFEWQSNVFTNEQKAYMYKLGLNICFYYHFKLP